MKRAMKDKSNWDVHAKILERTKVTVPEHGIEPATRPDDA